MKKFKKILLKIPIYLILGWVLFALFLDLYLVYLDFSGNEQAAFECSKNLLSKINY
jgi:hypothetical protein